MRPPGSFKVAYRNRVRRKTADARDAAALRDGLPFGIDDRAQRLIRSLRDEIVEGGDALELRIRCVFESPREIYRLEIEDPARDYQRTTLLDRDALEELLEFDAVREIAGPDALQA